MKTGTILIIIGIVLVAVAVYSLPRPMCGHFITEPMCLNENGGSTFVVSLFFAIPIYLGALMNKGEKEDE